MHGRRQGVGPIQQAIGCGPLRCRTVEGPVAVHDFNIADVAMRHRRTRQLCADAPHRFGNFRVDQPEPLERQPERRPGHTERAACLAGAVDDRRDAAAHAEHDLPGKPRRAASSLWVSPCDALPTASSTSSALSSAAVPSPCHADA